MRMVRLTEKELAAVLAALSNSTGHSDVMEALFPDGRERQACWRGEQKLQAALSSEEIDNG